MSGAVLVGTYSIVGQAEEKTPRTERYTIARVSKLKDDQWLFVARIQYGDKDLSVPIPLDVKWAGDTPVITLTDLTVPKLGTFTSRVMIYRDQYAGTWQHGDVGGHLWGKVEHPAADGKEKPEPKKADGESK